MTNLLDRPPMTEEQAVTIAEQLLLGKTMDHIRPYTRHTFQQALGKLTEQRLDNITGGRPLSASQRAWESTYNQVVATVLAKLAHRVVERSINRHTRPEPRREQPNMERPPLAYPQQRAQHNTIPLKVFNVLIEAEEKKEGPLTIRELAQRTGANQGSIRNTIKRLLQQNLLLESTREDVKYHPYGYQLDPQRPRFDKSFGWYSLTPEEGEEEEEEEEGEGRDSIVTTDDLDDALLA